MVTQNSRRWREGCRCSLRSLQGGAGEHPADSGGYCTDGGPMVAWPWGVVVGASVHADGLPAKMAEGVDVRAAWAYRCAVASGAAVPTALEPYSLAWTAAASHMLNL